MQPVPFVQLFKYASGEDLFMLGIGCLFILYSSLNIPLVNIVYGLMMREMNDYVARRAQFGGEPHADKLLQQVAGNITQSAPEAAAQMSYNINATSSSMPPIMEPFNGTLDEAKELFIDSSYRLCMIVILFGFTRLIALYLALLFFSRAAANQAKRVKLLFFKSLLRQEVAWFERNRTGDFAIRITSDLSKFEDGMGEKIALCLNALFAWLSSLASSFYYGWELTLVCMILVPLTVFITTVIAEFQASYSIKEGSALSHAFNVCHEVIMSIRTVLSFSGQNKEAQRFKGALDNAYSFGLKRNMFAALNLGFTWMSGYLGFAICLLYSTKFYKPEYYGAYDEAHIITILWSAAGCVFLLNRMMPFIEIIQMARGSAANLFAVIERESLIDVTSAHGLKPAHFEANVLFSDVCFTYANKALEHTPAPEPELGSDFSTDSSATTASTSAATATSPSTSSSSTNSSPSTASDRLTVREATSSDEDDDETPTNTTTSTALASDRVPPRHRQQQQQMSPSRPQNTITSMCMEVKSGQTIALVGPSGSGKSTALALLQRFYDIDSGSITLGGHELRDLNLGWLRGQFGVVTQEPVLFDMSIADNIRLGARPDQCVSDYDVEQAARSANAHAFIVRLPGGYATRAGARGVQLSGGQKQRIAIARALVRQPKILLLDEATSALDLESESIVQKALDQARIGRTTFIVAHRLSTVRNADKIIVFDKGTIIEQGTHDELLHRRGLYYQIHSQQRQGLDLVPASQRRNSQHAAAPASLLLSAAAAASQGAGGCVSGIAGSAVGAASSADASASGLRESRSLSIYSTTNMYAVAGHGGNGDGVDNAGGSCAGCVVGPAVPTAADLRFANDDDYYYNHEDEEDDEDDDESLVVDETSGASTSATMHAASGDNDNGSQMRSRASMAGANQRHCMFVGAEETQASLLDNDSLALINSKGKRVSSLSVLSVLRFIRPDVTCTIIGIVSSMLMGMCIPISAMIIGDIATIFSTDDAAEIRAGLFSHGLLYTGLAVFAFCISFVQVVSFGIAGERIGAELRLRGFKAIMRRDIAWFDHKRNSPGSICARLASDVGNVQSITGNRTAVIFQSISILVSTFVFAVYYNLKFSSVCAMFVATLLISTCMQARYAGKLAVANRGFDSQIGKIVLESSANIKTLVSLHQEKYFIDKVEQLLIKDRRSRSLDNHLRLSLESLKYALTAISKGSSFYFAARMLLRDEISIDVIFKLIEIILYGLTEASKSLIFISDLEKARRGTQNLYKLIYSHRLEGSPASDSRAPSKSAKHKRNDDDDNDDASPFAAIRFAGMKDALPEVKVDTPSKKRNYLPSLLVSPASNYKRLESSPNGDAAAADDASAADAACCRQMAEPLFGSIAGGGGGKCEGNIKFNSVRFKYPSRPDACVLKSLSLDIPAGKTVALVGRSGCGKSTIVQLLERFYEHSAGEIKLDGSELRRLSTEWVRKQIALVSQEPTLLSYSIGDNIRYGDNTRQVHFDEVVRAAQTANIHDFIMTLPEQYETMLSESNSLQLSGGQKQRIAIARALVRQAPILIFDEATSALDTKSERVVQDALDRARVGKTSIIIAHRLSTIKSADKIVVLRDGQVVEQGTHDELFERHGEYYCLYTTQSKL